MIFALFRDNRTMKGPLTFTVVLVEGTNKPITGGGGRSFVPVY